jgi:hypothetical protein
MNVKTSFFVVSRGLDKFLKIRHIRILSGFDAKVGKVNFDLAW